MGWVDFPDWLFQWPVILIAIGAVNLIINRFQSIGGWILFLLGSYFYVNRNFDIPFELSYYFWPSLLIVIGLIVLLRPRTTQSAAGWWSKRNTNGTTFFDAREGVDPSDVIKEQVAFGGLDKSFTSKNFQGGRISCALGGAELYLGECDFTGQVSLQIDAFMGGVSITVPKHWHLVVKTSALLGGVDDARKNVTADPATSPTLILTGSVFMAGLEIKSV